MTVAYRAVGVAFRAQGPGPRAAAGGPRRVRGGGWRALPAATVNRALKPLRDEGRSSACTQQTREGLSRTLWLGARLVMRICPWAADSEVGRFNRLCIFVIMKIQLDAPHRYVAVDRCALDA